MMLAQVVAVHPERRSVDLVMLHNGARYAEAGVIGTAASDMAAWAVPSVPRPPRETAAGGRAPNGRTLHAVVEMIQGRAIVLGFISPLGGAATTEQNRAFYRHPSGTYVTIAPDGAVEINHAGGTNIRIGAGAHAAVPGLPPTGAGAPVLITVTTGALTITADPIGKVTIVGDVEVQGTITATVDVIGGGKSLKTHVHSGVTAGGGNTGQPV